MMHRKLFTIINLFLIVNLYSQTQPAFLTDHNKAWVDRIFNSMTLEQKIGQLLMPRGNVSGKPHDIEKLKKWVKEYKIGGIVFFAGAPSVQARITNELQSISDIPLFIGEDFEWGLGMRMDSTDRFPYQMALGAMQGNEQLIEEMGREIGRQCKRLGVHINYAPVVDVNNNINNPVINFRSFGSSKLNVTNKGLAYMKGLQSQNIIATAKHFPGHGDTNVDSHHDLPVISHDIERLNDIEFYPFQALINNGLAGIMTAHLELPKLESTKGLASTFSKKIITELLGQKMKFKGLTFTDAMDMKGAIKNFPKGESIVQAFLAGNDIMETFEDVPEAIEALKKAIKDGRISEKLLNDKVKKILMAKSWVGLDKYKPIDLNNLIFDLNTERTDYLNREFAESSVTLLKNQNNFIPVDLSKKYAILSIDAPSSTSFQEMCKNYTNVDLFNLPTNAKDSLINALYETIKDYDYLIVGLHLKEVRASSKYSINESNLKSIKTFSNHKNAGIAIFGNVLALPQLPLDNYNAVLVAYQNTRYTEEATAQILFSGLPAKGRLPISLNDVWKEGYGLSTEASRMSYGIPEQVGINGRMLRQKIDSILLYGIKKKAYPGGVVCIVKDNKNILYKAYGHHTYEDAINDVKGIQEIQQYNVDSKSDAMDFFEKVKEGFNKSPIKPIEVKGRMKKTDIFDLASITKISAAALSVMKLMSDNKFDINQSFAYYVPSLKGSNKEGMIFKNLLTHKAGLKAWIPFWRDAVDTIATCHKALKQNPGLENEFSYIIKKPGFFKRLFGKKPVKIYLIKESLDKNPDLFTKILTSKTITWKENIFSPVKTASNGIKIHDKMWLKNDYPIQIKNTIKQSPVNFNQGYVYSDLHYYYYPEMIESLAGKKYENILEDTYKALGSYTLTYNPLNKFSKEVIVPTEYDSLFRGGLIHGMVHDEGAAMMGGISGHAGLFGNANDLSKLMLMYLNKGKYGDKQIIKKEVVEVCTSYQYPTEKNRRGLFFDKPDFENKTNCPQTASPLSYGHSGFTGTYTWVEPNANYLYVILTNRVYPTRENKLISDLNIRTSIGDAINQCINTFSKF